MKTKLPFETQLNEWAVEVTDSLQDQTLQALYQHPPIPKKKK